MQRGNCRHVACVFTPHAGTPPGRLGSLAGLWLLYGVGRWAVEEKEPGQFVENVDAFFREESTVLELGWNTCHALWGQGFATEAAVPTTAALICMFLA